jgi:hypothetical protein
MKHLLFAAFLFVPLPVLAADVTVSVGTVSEIWPLNAGDQIKFEQWVQYAYPCKPIPPATTCTPLTLAESESMWVKAILQGTVNNVNQYHKFLAAQEAAKGVMPIASPADTKKK